MIFRNFLLILLSVLAGCAENSSIYHSRQLSPAGDRVITLDAKQRSLMISRDREGAWRMCAEAAPDVFSALSASASLSADVASKSGRAAFAMAEAAGSIERTQTVNLLRESMYRTCERYLDGAIGPSQLVVQAARDQRAMVKILAIEQLTRAMRPPATILAAPPTLASSVDGETTAGLIKDFAQERSDSKTALNAATARYAQSVKTGKCDSVTVAPADDSSTPKLSEWTACMADAATKTARQKTFEDATDRLDKLLATAGQLAGQTGASTGAGTTSAGGGGGAPSDAALTSVADAVKTIALSPDIDEALMFCIAYLDQTPRVDRALVPNPDTETRCRDILVQRAQQDDQVRKTLIDFAGQGIVVEDQRSVRQSRERSVLNSYLTTPGGTTATAKAERQRRIALVRQVGSSLGISLSSPDVAGLPRADAAILARIVAMLRTTETDPVAAAVLGN